MSCVQQGWESEFEKSEVMDYICDVFSTHTYRDK